ncbi:MAG: sensor histidine kinase [Brachybacterium sp.]|nr:sensor histidine kinase [Brachybacterium sp.]
MPEAGTAEHPCPGPFGRDTSEAVHRANRSRLARQEEDRRVWDLLQWIAPWLLLAVSTAGYVVSALRASDGGFWADGAFVLTWVAIAAVWVFFGHTLPLRRKTMRPRTARLYFVGLLVVCVILMTHSEFFIVFTIAAFFQAYLLTPWPLGVLGVFATSVVLNGSAMHVWSDPTRELIMMFGLIVLVQTAAIGVGIPFAARTATAEREREHLVERLEGALHENAGLHAQLVAQARESGAQDERQRLAREIHDTLAQGLAGIITQLQSAQHSTGGEPLAERHVARALQVARASLSEARRSVQALGPQELSRAHLPDALRTLTEQWSKDEGVCAQFEVTGPAEPMSPAIEVSLFRVVQEALTNVAKHAEASRVGVTLSYTGTELLLDVRDDGSGFSNGESAGFGITSMRQRIRGVGGHVTMQSTLGDGTAVSARVPAITPVGTGDQEVGYR